MAIGPIPPILPLPVAKSPEKREEWPKFSLEGSARTEDERYSSGGGPTSDEKEDEEQTDSFESELASAEEESTEQPSEEIQPNDEEPGSVSFFA